MIGDQLVIYLQNEKEEPLCGNRVDSNRINFFQAKKIAAWREAASI